MLSDRRDGRYVYYRLKNEALLSLLNDTASLSGIPAGQLNTLTNPNPGPNCECPHCAPNLIPLERAPVCRAVRGELVQNVRLQQTRTDGTTVWRSISAAPIRDANGAVVGAVALRRSRRG